MKNGGVGQREDDSEPIEFQSPSCGRKFAMWLKNNILLILIILGVVLGLLIGFILKLHSGHEFTAKEISYISFPGVIFLNMLKLLIIPLVITSVVAGLASLDVKTSGRMGWRTIVYYLCTTVLAVILGIILVVAINPGQGNPDDMVRQGASKKVKADDAFMDLIRNIFPPNLVGATFQKYQTKYIEERVVPPTVDPANMTTVDPMLSTISDENATEPGYEVIQVDNSGMVGGMNILGIIVFSIVLGVTIARMGTLGAPLVVWFTAMNEAIMRIVWVVMWYSPIGIMFLIMGRVIMMDDWTVIAGQLGMYCVTVITGLLIHGLIVLPLAYFIFARKNPIKFLLGVLPALMTAFGTASSSATLPVTIRCLERRIGLDRRVTQFVLPVGATINMDGTALYEAVAAIFIAQVNNFDLDIGQYITISITATLASIGAAGIPEAGLVTMVIVLSAVGLPTEDVALIFVIDWLIDRIRTTVNVFGDSVGAGIINRFTLRDFEREEKEKFQGIDEIELGDAADGTVNQGFTKEELENPL